MPCIAGDLICEPVAHSLAAQGPGDAINKRLTIDVINKQIPQIDTAISKQA